VKSITFRALIGTEPTESFTLSQSVSIKYQNASFDIVLKCLASDSRRMVIANRHRLLVAISLLCINLHL